MDSYYILHETEDPETLRLEPVEVARAAAALSDGFRVAVDTGDGSVVEVDVIRVEDRQDDPVDEEVTTYRLVTEERFDEVAGAVVDVLDALGRERTPRVSLMSAVQATPAPSFDDALATLKEIVGENGAGQ